MPAVSEPPAPSLPTRIRPVGVRVASSVFSVLLVGTVVAVWLTLPAEVQESFTFAQRATVALMGIGALAVCYGLSRCRIDVANAGVTVVNGYRTHHFEWGQVVAVTLRPGNPWAVLDLSDGTTQSAMGIQGSDGAKARRQVRQLRALIEAHDAPDPRG